MDDDMVYEDLHNVLTDVQRYKSERDEYICLYNELLKNKKYDNSFTKVMKSDNDEHVKRCYDAEAKLADLSKRFHDLEETLHPLKYACDAIAIRVYNRSAGDRFTYDPKELPEKLKELLCKLKYDIPYNKVIEEYKSAVFCEHANESPYNSGPERCICSLNCSCREFMCKPTY